MGNSYTTLPRRVSSRLLQQFMESHLLRRMYRHRYLMKNTLNPFTLEKEVTPGIDFLAVSFEVDIESHRDM